jgi:hypothetical protein
LLKIPNVAASYGRDEVILRIRGVSSTLVEAKDTVGEDRQIKKQTQRGI